ncbi:MAG: DNA mismatch repair protein MutS [Bacteroidales bacterium]|jgi:DNA mismatch repair protein MutS|nr:DNA mismatch repair protein MutS [Bacteroidales bacterium]
MKQYYSIKGKHPDAILLFRVGDFYETYGEDAIQAAEILGITLTRRSNGMAANVELAGFPYHALDTYLPRLVRAGLRVAICEQLEDPKLAKTLVKRGVTELITPGVVLNDQILENKENNFLACVHTDKNVTGIAFLDISTGEFLVAEGNTEYADKLLNGLHPKEVLLERRYQSRFKETFGTQFNLSVMEDWAFVADTAREKLLSHFNIMNLKGFGVEGQTVSVVAAGAILQYLNITHHERAGHINRISRIDEDAHVWLDKFTIHNLELLTPACEGGHTLCEVLDHTHTPMGARLLKRWITLPLKNIHRINERLDVVEYLTQQDMTGQIGEPMRRIGDLERMTARIAAGKVSPREMQQLGISLSLVKDIKDFCADTDSEPLKRIAEQLNPCTTICRRIARELKKDLPAVIGKGNVIADGVSEELDGLRGIRHSGKGRLEKMQQDIIEQTGISSLKVDFNSVFGYYIEVRNTHKHKVPSGWIRKQTLVNAERYITEELKAYESKILGAEEQILALETELFSALVNSVIEYIPAVQLDASLIARLDCLQSFARAAAEHHYVKPLLTENDTICIRQGRHPVIEAFLPPDNPYVANDLQMDSVEQQIMVITGPNMSGKSALLRQTALIALMAQTGSYVPAQEAEIGYVDKIFTRVGASDNISQGESTFMVEMTEAASILNNLSQRSLILLDEIGRGTSTYDGISIAWAMAEYIHEHPTAKAKTLFATHYHELNEMEKSFSRIKNYHVAVKELNQKVIFLRKLTRGGSEHSFGIHVARMAGMPKSIVARAEEILKELEKSAQTANSASAIAKPVADLSFKREGYQLSIFQLDDPVLKQIRDEIKKTDINNITPLEALQKLNEIKKWVGLK